VDLLFASKRRRPGLPISPDLAGPGSERRHRRRRHYPLTSLSCRRFAGTPGAPGSSTYLPRWTHL